MSEVAARLRRRSAAGRIPAAATTASCGSWLVMLPVGIGVLGAFLVVRRC
jgi:hypothetical protein